MFRLVLVLIGIIPATIYTGFRMLWVVYRKSPSSACVCDSAPRQWARFILRCSGVKIVLENAEVIDPNRPQILVANHESWFDVLAILAQTPGRTIFVAKKELERIWIFGPAVAACGHIFIDREDRGRAVDSLAVARKRLEEESPTVIMFPEGTRSATGEMRPFKKGAFVLAIQTGVDVVPAAICGSRAVMRKGSLFIRPGTVVVRFGEPISVQGLTLDARNDLSDRAREALTGLRAAAAR